MLDSRPIPVVLLLLLCLSLPPVAGAGTDIHDVVTRTVPGAMETKEGVVRFHPQGQPRRLAEVPQALVFGDGLETYRLSRAGVRLRDGSRVRMRELTRLRIIAGTIRTNVPSIELEEGSVYYSNRGRDPRTVSFRTPQVTGLLLGTEFVISVWPARGQTEVTMLDGEVELTDGIALLVARAGEQAVASEGQGIRVRPLIEATNLVQWWIYYPGVLDPDNLTFGPGEADGLRGSLEAYRQGDVRGALESFPGYPEPGDQPAEARRVYLAGLLLAAGAVDQAETLIESVDTSPARALRMVIAAARSEAHRSGSSSGERLSSEWLALSYLHQARHELEAALEAAVQATAISPGFAFGWVRVAELEFGFGRSGRARRAVDRALALAPLNAQAHALLGFLLSGEDRIGAALSVFDRAVELDSGLGNARLGRGLCLIREGRAASGLEDLAWAALMEPNRSLFHSYLGKAFADQGRFEEAHRELAFAERLDPSDPTPRLYSALVSREENRVNAALADLERSLELNDNRAVYRSRLLLDRDRAVRSSSLAQLYQSAGMGDVGMREAARAGMHDYANYSAHLFLSDGLNALRDPSRFNLRYETAWFNELLLANLLSPVGGTPLSQQVSQQEYSRLFERDRLGLSSSTEYRGDGQLRQLASQYGAMGRMGWSLDLDYQRNDGVRSNNELERIEWYSTVKYQLNSRDSLLLLAKYEDYHSGDNFQYYDPTNARPNFVYDETQAPIVVGAFHHEWGPGMHTMALGGRLENEQEFSDLAVPLSILFKDTSVNPIGDVVAKGSVRFDVRLHGTLEVFPLELQHIFQTDRQTIVLGGRYQWGRFETRDLVDNPSSNSGLFDAPAGGELVEETFERGSGYAYYTVRPMSALHLTGGLAYEQMRYPANFRAPPLQAGRQSRERFNPKAALAWDILPGVTVRGAYAKSLGGASLDESYRLEPTQLAGFVQSFRTVIPESLAGSVAAPEHEIAALALDLKFPTKTYLGFQGGWHRSEVNRVVGVFDYVDFVSPIVPSSTRQELDYEEWSAAATLHQLLEEEWALGAQYRFTEAKLRSAFPDIPVFLPPASNTTNSAQLHELSCYALYNHQSGIFARAETRIFWQKNAATDASLPGDSFYQVNLFAGYRFARQRGDITVGLLNLTDQDYRLNPVTSYLELARERAVYARLRFRF